MGSWVFLSTAARRRSLAVAFAVPLCAANAVPSPARAQDPFADAVVAYEPGVNGGFGSDLLPDILLGPPRAGGPTQGSLDVLALGIGGSVILRFDLPVICDGPGADFTVFENAFRIGSLAGPLFTEFAYVAVSQDGVLFTEFPFDADTGIGLAGRTPVLSHPDNGISALDPAVSGGDLFDLADIGLAWASHVKITDVAGAIPDVGDMPQFTLVPNAGFDLDALAAVNACDPSAIDSPTPTPTHTQVPTAPSPTPTAVDATATATPPEGTTPSPTATAALPGDLDGDGQRTDADELLLVAEIFDGDGDGAAAAGGGAIASGPAADVNADARIGAADVTALAALRTR
jgi:hypothetical protein